MMTDRILITGGSGMVGSQFPFGIKPSSTELDITNTESIEKALDNYKPTVVIHLAALTDMQRCEENPDLAYSINVTGVENIARACKERKIKLVYISSCAVFDGKKNSPYIESDTPGPLNVYGKTKLCGEERVLSVDHANLVIRTGWLFGGGSHDKKFVKVFIEALKENKPITAVGNRYGNPTYIPDLIRAIHTLIAQDAEGIFHVANTGVVSYEEAAKILKSMIPESTSLITALEVDFATEALPRGKMEGLASTKLSLRSWKEAAQEYLEILP